MRDMAHAHAKRLSRAVVMGTMLVVLTAGSTIAEHDTDERPATGIAVVSVVGDRVEWTLADIYAGYADAKPGEQPEDEVTPISGVDDPVEWSLADIYAGYADAETDEGAR